jgi:hypothetical protein
VTLQTRLADLVTAIATDIKTIRTYVTGTPTGNLSGLQTTDKASLVGAINEVRTTANAAGGEASTSARGTVELATNAEALAMADTTVVLTPSNLTALANVANGLVKLDGTTKIPSALIPGSMDDVREFANLAGFPATGETGVLFVAIDNGKTYRWSGSAYVEISPAPGSTDSVPEGSVNLYYTQARADARADARIATRIGNEETDLAAAYAAAKA